MSSSQIKEEKWDALKAIYYLKILANTGRINSELLGTPSIFFSGKCANARSVLEGVSLSVGVSVGGNPKLPFYGNPSWFINAPRIHQSNGNFSLRMFIVRYQGFDPGCWHLTWSPKTLLPVTEFCSFFTCYTAPIFQWCRAMYNMGNEEQISYTTAVIRW